MAGCAAGVDQGQDRFWVVNRLGMAIALNFQGCSSSTICHKAERSGPATTSAELCPVGLHRRARDRFLLSRTERSVEPRSRPASCTHTPVRYIRVHSEAEWLAGPRLQNRAYLAPWRCPRRVVHCLESWARADALSVLHSSDGPAQ
jgi:hypothetical protein